jgi:type II protein arginine methyltransferase
MDTTRYVSIDFNASIDCTLHGIAGYFDCNLYKDIMLSIVPETHSQGLFSWFSMYFPIYVSQI